MSVLPLGLFTASRSQRAIRSPVVEGHGLELAVVSPSLEGGVLVVELCVTYRLPLEVASAYPDVGRAIVLLVEDPSKRRAGMLDFGQPSPDLDLDAPPPFKGISKGTSGVSVTGFATADARLEVGEDHGPLFFRAVLREHVSSIVEVRRDVTIIHPKGGADVVLEGDDR